MEKNNRYGMTEVMPFQIRLTNHRYDAAEVLFLIKSLSVMYGSIV